ncbi:hypothetical protein QQX10_04825 [Demequina sp. SYSU T00039]|uniref:Uncharacterized protein n=1 Tax=Demequina lignilytica TaxID=3051663 RepID=A0AAW7M900_9MICO|nr:MULTISPECIES: hypothetical protein [unclassified Demequina]MDN4477318.1 hypothetical protein [Demequina sp. SYSU T00039-1]MDN4487491.1 hypothetical protein [Demequina sp. SYSU T00039]MDN4491039.1 hypothetical protein [Demequina sp. SYSU T00068]
MNTPDLIPVDAALEEFELEVAHRPLVRQIALRAGIVGGELKASYVKLHRIDGMHPLHVTHRGVEWFSSEVEVVSASGLPEAVWSKTNRAGTTNWGVAFPKIVVAAAVSVDDAVLAPAGGASDAPADAPRPARLSKPASPKPVERDYGVCDRCWQARTAAGACGCD